MTSKAFAFALAASMIASCRSSSICEGDGCARADAAARGDAGAMGEGGASGRFEPAASGASGLDQAAAGGSAALDEGGTGAGGSAAGAGGEEMSDAGAGMDLSFEPCDAPAADCDGSTQTRCESSVDWNARNCGACGVRCSGACAQGRCGEPQVVLHDARARAFVAGDPAHYVLTELEQVVSVDRTSLAVTLLAEGLAGATHLARAGDQLYAWGEGSDEGVYSVSTSGGPVKAGLFPDRTSFGASQDGVYYINSDDGRLWFRPVSLTRFVPIPFAEPYEIVASCAAAIVVRGGSVSEAQPVSESQLVRISQGQVTPLGPALLPDKQTVCGDEVVAVMGGPAEAREIYLYDKNGVTPTLLGIDYLAFADPTWLLSGVLGVSLTWLAHGNTSLRIVGVRQVGLPLNAIAVHADRDFVWYNLISPEDFAPQLVRAGYSIF